MKTYMNSSIYFIIFLFILNYEYVNSLFTKSSRGDPLNDIKIHFYYGNKNRQHSVYKLKNIVNILNHTKFFINKKTTLYIHGYNETQARTSTPYLRRAYSYRDDYNFLTLDYNVFVNQNYVTSVHNVPFVGEFVARALIQFFEAGLPIQRLHLVGHSLGGQLSGYIGRNIKQMTRGKRVIERITALDPAFPLFYIFQVLPPLESNDAKFVDVIHTDAGIFGAPLSTGTVDFWPNGGVTTQPGCPSSRHLGLMDNNDFCSHWKSWQFWAEDVTNLYEKKFVAYKAKSYDEFRSKKLRSFNDVTFMGLETLTTNKGNYYLYTNPKPPYAMTEIYNFTISRDI